MYILISMDKEIETKNLFHLLNIIMNVNEEILIFVFVLTSKIDRVAQNILTLCILFSILTLPSFRRCASENERNERSCHRLDLKFAIQSVQFHE